MYIKNLNVSLIWKLLIGILMHIVVKFVEIQTSKNVRRVCLNEDRLLLGHLKGRVY